MGGAPPPRGWVQVPVATQEVRLGPWKVEALGCEDQGGCMVSRAPEAEEAALGHMSFEAGAGPHLHHHACDAPAPLQSSPGGGESGGGGIVVSSGDLDCREGFVEGGGWEAAPAGQGLGESFLLHGDTLLTRLPGPGSPGSQSRNVKKQLWISPSS